jgi:hypothetical protein
LIVIGTIFGELFNNAFCVSFKNEILISSELIPEPNVFVVTSFIITSVYLSNVILDLSKENPGLTYKL